MLSMLDCDLDKEGCGDRFKIQVLKQKSVLKLRSVGCQEFGAKFVFGLAQIR